MVSNVIFDLFNKSFFLVFFSLNSIPINVALLRLYIAKELTETAEENEEHYKEK